MPSPAPHTPPRRLCRGIPIRFCRRPPPRPRLRREIPVHFCRHPRPTRAFARRYPCTSAGTPAPPALSQGDTRALLPATPPRTRLCRDAHALLLATPPRPRLRKEIPVHFCRQPPPRPRLRKEIPIRFCQRPHRARACGAPPPPRGRGRGPCPGVYQGSSRARGGAGGPPRPALSHLSPGTGPWGYRHGGWG